MDVTVWPQELTGEIAAPSSKSEAHRVLICAALADGVTDVDCTTTSQDIDATASCLRALGARVTRTRKGFRVVGLAGTSAAEGALLDCGESGSTLRFLLPVVCALGNNIQLTGHGRLAERPLSPLFEELQAHGCALSEQGTFPLETSGQLTGGRFVLPGDVSSQYVSGLLMASPLVEGPVEVLVMEPVESRPYIDMTIAALARFGVAVAQTHVMSQDGESAWLLEVPADAHYQTPGTLTVGGDWSNGAFWLAAGAISQVGVAVTGLDPRSTQGDRTVLAALALLGACVQRSRDGAACQADASHGCAIDVSGCPDLVPPLAAAAAHAQGTTRITGAARLRLKESDRLATVSAALNAMGGRVEIVQDGLIIEGTSLAGGIVDAANDHRIAMMAAVAATRATGPTTIRGAECVAKSYPGFFEDFKALGGACSKEEA